jgi:hypothetical protein
MNLTRRELWLMERAFVAARCNWTDMQAWLNCPAGDSHIIGSRLVGEAPPAPTPVDYQAIHKQDAFSLNRAPWVTFDRMLAKQEETNRLLVKLIDCIRSRP